MTLKTRPPTGAVPWPVVLLEGPEKAGKSYSAAEFTASTKIGQSYWIDIAEGAADEYGAIPGANYLVVEHDGSYNTIYNAIVDVKTEAAKAAERGEPPVVLVIDSMTAEWDLIKDWVDERARRSKTGQEALKKDPDAEIKPSMNLWNDGNARHGRLMAQLLTFPGIVIITARGKEVASLDKGGRPIPNTKEYKVEGHKNLAYDATVWVRLSREMPPHVVGARSVHHGIRPGVDEAQPVPDFTLEWLIFEVLKCDPSKAHVREIKQPSDRDTAWREMVEAAKQMGWDQPKLAQSFAEEYPDTPLKDATAEQFRYMRDFLRMCLQQPEEAAGDARVSEPDGEASAA